MSFSYNEIPLRFESNHGQTDRRVKFLSRGRDCGFFFTPTEVVIALSGSPTLPDFSRRRGKRQEKVPVASVVRMTLANANPNPSLVGLGELPGKAHYFTGRDRKKWRAGIPTYAKVKYEDVYRGVDLIYYGNQRRLEYDFLVAPGADPQAITFSLTGAGKLELDGAGELVLETLGEKLRLERPFAYQNIGSAKQTIPSGYVLKEGGEVSFQIAAYDSSRPLIIDPVLSYSTYLGGSGFEGGSGIAIGPEGNIFVAGGTASADFPTADPYQPALNGNFDAFITKLNPEGTDLIYSTYLGGDSLEDSLALAVDADGNAYLTGRTDSHNFPTTPGAFQPVFGGGIYDSYVAKLNADGSALLYSTYLGGSRGDAGASIAADSDGRAYLTGDTQSPDFPTVNAFQRELAGPSDAFIVKLDPVGSPVYSTYLGGSDWENGYGIAVDQGGNAYSTGSTASPDFPTLDPVQATLGGFADAFVTKLDPEGSSLIYSTYLGGRGSDFGGDIAVDPDGQAHMTGRTLSTDFPTENPIQPALSGGLDAFVAKLNAAGSALLYSTYLGGVNLDVGNGIAVDRDGGALVSGETVSPDFPVINAVQPNFAGVADAFVAKLSPDGRELAHSTFLGGTERDHGVDIALDLDGGAYVAGGTVSRDFPTVRAFQDSLAGSADVFVSRIGMCTGASILPITRASLSSPGRAAMSVAESRRWRFSRD